MFTNLVIMAAGRSTRMWPLTEYVPKAMALADGKTLIQTTVEKFKSKGFNIYVTVGYKSEVLSPYALKLGVNGLINTEGKGNCWWIYNSILSNLNEPVVVITCDSLMDVNLEKLYENYVKYNKPSCMLLPTECKQGFDGDFIHEKNGLITKLSREEKTSIYGSGCQVLNPYKIKEETKESNDFLELWSQLIEQKQLYCADFIADNWFTFDTVEQLKMYDNLKK